MSLFKPGVSGWCIKTRQLDTCLQIVIRLVDA